MGYVCAFHSRNMLCEVKWNHVWIFSYLFVWFLGPHPQHIDVPRLGVQSEAYITATAMWDWSCVCDLHHSSGQCQILNPMSKARDQTSNLMVLSRICFCWATMELLSYYLLTNYNILGPPLLKSLLCCHFSRITQSCFLWCPFSLSSAHAKFSGPLLWVFRNQKNKSTFQTSFLFLLLSKTWDPPSVFGIFFTIYSSLCPFCWFSKLF